MKKTINKKDKGNEKIERKRERERGWGRRENEPPWLKPRDIWFISIYIALHIYCDFILLYGMYNVRYNASRDCGMVTYLNLK